MGGPDGAALRRGGGAAPAGLPLHPADRALQARSVRSLAPGSLETGDPGAGDRPPDADGVLGPAAHRGAGGPLAVQVPAVAWHRAPRPLATPLAPGESTTPAHGQSRQACPGGTR